jgi:hypothetical protein
MVVCLPCGKLNTINRGGAEAQAFCLAANLTTRINAMEHRKIYFLCVSAPLRLNCILCISKT